MKTAFKILLIIIVFLVVIFTVLSSLGGNGDTYKNAIESLIEERLPGHDARIETLNQMRFFPYLGFDIEGIEIVNVETQNIVSAADKMQAAMPFWDVAFGTGKMSSLHIQNLGLVGGVLHPQIIGINQAAILKRNGGAFFEANGNVGDQKFTLSMPMNISGEADTPRFTFPQDRVFNAEIDGIKLSGILSRQDDDGAIVKEFLITRGAASLRGDVRLSFGETLKITAELLPSTSFDIDVQRNENISGLIRIENDAARNMIADIIRFWFGQEANTFPELKIEAQ